LKSRKQPEDPGGHGEGDSHSGRRTVVATLFSIELKFRTTTEGSM